MEELKIQRRLRAVADMVIPGNQVADIGTDHGYLPIYLAKKGISKKIFAMDVRKAPLEKAKQNVKSFLVQDLVECRLSDGLDALQIGEAQTITICGMGGRLIRNIMTRGSHLITNETQLIVSPQSEIREFREFLYLEGYEIVNEIFMEEDGQFYILMDCRRQPANYWNECKNMQKELLWDEVCLRYAVTCLQKKDACLQQFLLKEQAQLLQIKKQLEHLQENESVVARKANLEKDLQCNALALSCYLV